MAGGRRKDPPEQLDSDNLRASGKRYRQQRDPNSWSSSILTIRANILLLGMSYPSVDKAIKEFNLGSNVRIQHIEPSVEQAIELVRRRILVTIDGRDYARIKALEASNEMLAYTVSKEQGGPYELKRHLDGDFNSRNFVIEMRRQWGANIKFKQVILDYYWIPPGTWQSNHWKQSFFKENLPKLVDENLLNYGDLHKDTHLVRVTSHVSGGDYIASEAGVVYLPFCEKCFVEVVSCSKTLSKVFTISFVNKTDLSEHTLWKATNTISAASMQDWLEKRLDQEEEYCKLNRQKIVHGSEIGSNMAAKEDVLHVFDRIKNVEDIRMIKLTALRSNHPEYSEYCKQSTWPCELGVTKGGYVGLMKKSRHLRNKTQIQSPVTAETFSPPKAAAAVKTKHLSVKTIEAQPHAASVLFPPRAAAVKTHVQSQVTSEPVNPPKAPAIKTGIASVKPQKILVVSECGQSKVASKLGPTKGVALPHAKTIVPGKRKDPPELLSSDCRRASGKRYRQKRDLNSWTTSILTIRANILLLGMSYPSVREATGKFHYGSDVYMRHVEPSVDQAIELVERSLLATDDGRDYARIKALEASNEMLAYTISTEKGGPYELKRHLDADFNSTDLPTEMHMQWGANIKFKQVILDYFSAPSGALQSNNWKQSFFKENLPKLVDGNLLNYGDLINDSYPVLYDDTHSGTNYITSEAGVVYLPFCEKCFVEVVACSESLSEVFTISFLGKGELNEHTLWKTTNTISAESMQVFLGKDLDQEEKHCKLTRQQLEQLEVGSNVATKEDVLHVFDRIKNVEDMRMIKLTALRCFHPEYKRSRIDWPCDLGVKVGGFVGLLEQPILVNSHDHSPIDSIPSSQPKPTAPLSAVEESFLNRLASLLCLCSNTAIELSDSGVLVYPKLLGDTLSGHFDNWSAFQDQLKLFGWKCQEGGLPVNGENQYLYYNKSHFMMLQNLVGAQEPQKNNQGPAAKQSTGSKIVLNLKNAIYKEILLSQVQNMQFNESKAEDVAQMVLNLLKQANVGTKEPGVNGSGNNIYRHGIVDPASDEDALQKITADILRHEEKARRPTKSLHGPAQSKLVQEVNDTNRKCEKNATTHNPPLFQVASSFDELVSEYFLAQIDVINNEDDDMCSCKVDSDMIIETTSSAKRLCGGTNIDNKNSAATPASSTETHLNSQSENVANIPQPSIRGRPDGSNPSHHGVTSPIISSPALHIAVNQMISNISITQAMNRQG